MPEAFSVIVLVSQLIILIAPVNLERLLTTLSFRLYTLAVTDIVFVETSGKLFIASVKDFNLSTSKVASLTVFRAAAYVFHELTVSSFTGFN